MSLKFVTLNVNGMGDNSKRNAVFHWCRKRNFDVICLQETHCTNKKEIELKRE